LGAGEGFEGEGLGDEVAEGVGTVGAGAVGFIDFGGDCAGGIGGPGDEVEVFDEFAAFGIDEEAGLAVGVAEAAVDAIDAVADGRVGGLNAIGGVIGADPFGEEVGFDNGPIGVGGGGAFLVAAGVAKDVNLHGPPGHGDHAVIDLNAFEKRVAGSGGVGVGEDDFVEDVDFIVIGALHEEHAHGVDVEVDRPDDRAAELE